MKTVIRFSIALALVFALIVGVSVSRAALMSYNSGFQVQNLEGTDANITIQFYDRSGTAVTTVTDTVPANTNNTYFPLTNLGNEGASVPAGFDGSVVIASDKKVASITNILGSDGSDPLAFGASYKGFTGGSNSASLPLLMKGNYGFNTWFSVQNVGSTSSNVTVTYSDGVVAGPIAVAPGAAAKFEQANEAHASGWVGSAVVDLLPLQWLSPPWKLARPHCLLMTASAVARPILLCPWLTRITTVTSLVSRFKTLGRAPRTSL